MIDSLDAARRLYAEGKPEPAIAMLERMATRNPAREDIREFLGAAYLGILRFDRAIPVLRELCDARPGDAKRALAAAAALARGGDEPAALGILERSTRHATASQAVWMELSVLQKRLGRTDEAVASARRAIALDRSRAAAHSALGNALVADRRWQEAIEPLSRAVHLAEAAGDRGAVARCRYNLAQAQVDCGAFAAAEQAYRGAIAADPCMADAHWGLGRLLLLLGRYAEGWSAHEWRLRSRFQRVRPDLLSRPRWNGERLAGRRLLVWREQGHGDALQFMRFLAMIDKDGGRLIVETRPGLRRLVERLGCADEIVTGDGGLPPFDLQIPIMSLGAVFAPSVDSLSGEPYLSVGPHPALGPAGAVTRVAFTFAGNPSNNFDGKRSLSAAAFLPLLETPGAEFVGLQIGERGRELDGLPGHLNVIDARPLVDDFADTAAVLRSCDLLVTACTSTAHLGGALGIPTWVLLWAVPDWRWLLGRSDSPWYRSVRLFRQDATGAWEPVIARVRAELEALVARRPAQGS
jgi:tetratricopeptide (TPR) repeat protein